MCSHCKMNMRKHCIDLHLKQKMPITQIAEITGYHQDTLYLWKSRYLKYGIEGLMDKSRAPHSHPNEYPDKVKEKIRELRTEDSNRRTPGPRAIRARMEKRYGIKISRSGIAKFLKKEGLIDVRKSRKSRKKNRIKRHKIKEPGELLQIDVKYAFKSYSGYWYYQYSSIDYLTNLACGNIYELQSSFESILFAQAITAFYPFELKGVQTDNHATFTNRYVGYLKSADPDRPRLHPFDIQCAKLGISHYLIDKGKPAQNGKAERFHRTCEEEFYQREAFKDLNSARKKFRDFLYYYNHQRENQGLDDLTPIEKLRTFPEYSNIKELIPNC